MIIFISLSISFSSPFLSFCSDTFAASLSCRLKMRYFGDSGTNRRKNACNNPVTPFKAIKAGHKSSFPKQLLYPSETDTNTPAANARGPAVATVPRIEAGVISLK